MWAHISSLGLQGQLEYKVVQLNYYIALFFLVSPLAHMRSILILLFRGYDNENISLNVGGVAECRMCKLDAALKQK